MRLSSSRSCSLVAAREPAVQKSRVDDTPNGFFFFLFRRHADTRPPPLMTFPKKEEEVFASETEATAAVACCHNGFQCYLILLNPHLVGKHWKSISGWPTVFRCWPAITSRFPLSYSFRLFFFVVLHPLVVVVVWTLFVAPATVEVVEKRRSSSGGHWTTFFVLFMNKYCINNLTFLCVVRESVFVFFFVP